MSHEYGLELWNAYSDPEVEEWSTEETNAVFGPHLFRWCCVNIIIIYSYYCSYLSIAILILALHPIDTYSDSEVEEGAVEKTNTVLVLHFFLAFLLVPMETMGYSRSMQEMNVQTEWE